MAKFSKTRIDRDKADNGVWLEYDEGIRVKISRLGNPEYVKRLRELELSKDELKNFYDSPKCMRLVAETVIRDIDAEDDNGAKIVYSPDFGEQTLLDPQYIDFKNFVIAKAGDETGFRVSQLMEDLGN